MSTEADIADKEIHDYLLQLDKLRVECEQRGEFAKAQECMNRMREVNFRQAKRLEALSRVSNAENKAQIMDSQRLELLTFTRVWEEKMLEYDQKAASAVATLKQSHMSEYANQEGMLRLQLLNRRPRFSRSVVDLRDQLEKAVQLRKYLEAESLKNKLAELERRELQAFDESLSATFERKAQGLKKQYINELRVVEQKIKTGRDELECQQKADLERLLRSHANALKELDSETKVQIAKTRKVLERQVSVLTNDPMKTSVDFKTIRQGVMSARSKTPNRQRVTKATNLPDQSHISITSIEAAPSARAAWTDDSRFLW